MSKPIKVKLDAENGKVLVNVETRSIEPGKIRLQCDKGILHIIPNWTGFHMFLVSGPDKLAVKIDNKAIELLDQLFFGQMLEGVTDFLYGYWSASYVVWREFRNDTGRFLEAFYENKEVC